MISCFWYVILCMMVKKTISEKSGGGSKYAPITLNEHIHTYTQKFDYINHGSINKKLFGTSY